MYEYVGSTVCVFSCRFAIHIACVQPLGGLLSIYTRTLANKQRANRACALCAPTNKQRTEEAQQKKSCVSCLLA